MTTKHTKGPWELKKGDCWTIIADGESIMGDMTYYPWCPSNEADWHLIAAAPCQHEALLATQLLLEQLGLQSSDEYQRNAAAIAKATGEQA